MSKATTHFPIPLTAQEIKKEKKSTSFKINILLKIVFKIRQIHAFIFNLLFHHDFVFKIIGILNRRLHFLKAIFIVYPELPWLAHAYVPKKNWPKMIWNPWLVSVYKLHKQPFGLKFVISATGKDISVEKNIENLKLLVNEAERIRKLIHADYKLFAGRLPGILYARGLIKNTPELISTVKVVEDVELKISHEIKYPVNTPLVILGGGGFVGSRLFNINHRSITRLDIKFSSKQTISTDFYHKMFVLINVSDRKALARHISRLHDLKSGTIIINEVYPPPNQEKIDMLTQAGIKIAHVVGSKGKALLPLPGPYKKAIPCCGVWPNEYIKAVYTWLN